MRMSFFDFLPIQILFNIQSHIFQTLQLFFAIVRQFVTSNEKLLQRVAMFHDVIRGGVRYVIRVQRQNFQVLQLLTQKQHNIIVDVGEAVQVHFLQSWTKAYEGHQKCLIYLTISQLQVPKAVEVLGKSISTIQA
uniref:(northern house mosquito) hypothetical protein n=1 Tax=Culex pipiens TaxID=7175 RepID=A0A8D8ADX7_CULPI